ncbi:MAG: hypothetical protein KatS3mg014_1910 [Actinomycetota bacterium]|nr:MAG: hypothetical protein KatS3mg014_1910 [Actinomycetota bacterium]
MTLSALSSSVAGSVGLGLAYVFGMTFPLFVLALSWDRLRLGERRWLRARPLRLRVAGRTIATNTVNVAVAAVFALMGVAVLALAATGDPTTAPSFQLAIGRWLRDAFAGILSFLEPVPEPVLGLALLALAGSIFVAAARGERPSAGPSAGRSDRHDHEGCTAGEGRPSHAGDEGRASRARAEVDGSGGGVAGEAAPPPSTNA